MNEKNLVSILVALLLFTDGGSSDCIDELPSDYSDSKCYKEWNFTTCKKIANEISGCNDLWKDTDCTTHDGYIKDTCRKSCGTCKDRSIRSYQQEGESCGIGLHENRGQCGKDLECVFGELELVGTCQIKKKQADCSISHEEGFKVTLGAICQGNTKKDLSDIFDTQFKEETLTNCKKFCNCQKDCKGFNFNPNSKKRKCSWKADSPIETFTNEGIQKSGQSCVIKEAIPCCRAFNAACNACVRRQEVEGYCRNNPTVFGCTNISE